MMGTMLLLFPPTIYIYIINIFVKNAVLCYYLRWSRAQSSFFMGSLSPSQFFHSTPSGAVRSFS